MAMISLEDIEMACRVNYKIEDKHGASYKKKTEKVY
jgi:hypothetical protein